MPAQVFGPEAAVSMLNRALNDQSPANAVFKNQVATAGTTEASINAFANTFANSNTAGQSDDALSTRVLGNMGLLPNPELQAALKDYFAANGVANRGLVILQLSNILAGLENATGSLAVYASAAAAWNNEVTGAYTYSVDPINTAPSSTGQNNVGTNFTLTVNQDTLNGSGANDTFNAGAAQDGAGNLINTLQSVDSIDGGAGTDTLNVTVATATAIAPTLKNVEAIVARFAAAGSLNVGAATGLTSVSIADSAAAAKVDGFGALSTVSVSNSTAAVDINDGTATSLTVNLNKVGSKAVTTAVAADGGHKATTLALNVTDSWAQLTESNQAKTVTIAATGANVIDLMGPVGAVTTLTTSGSGSVDLTAQDLAVLKTLTTGDGAVKVKANGALESYTGGAGGDTVTAKGSVLKTVAAGAGNDTLNASTDATTASVSIDMGAGDDTLSFATTGPTAGGTFGGGDGTDTISFNTKDYTNVAAFTSGNLAKFTGWETLGINDALDGAYDVSAIAGIVNFTANAGVATTKTGNVTKLGATTIVTLGGDLATNNGTLSVALATDSGSTDTVNLKLNGSYTENNDATATNTAYTENLKLDSKIETLAVNSSGKASTAFGGAAGNKADTVTNTLALDHAGTGNGSLTTITVTGDQAFAMTAGTSTTSFKKLATFDASALTAGATFDGSSAGGNDGTQLALTIKGSATASNTLIGNSKGDTIIGGSKADTITGGTGGDTLTGGAGNDVFKYATGGSDSTLVNLDTITDFTANTYGKGTAGAVNNQGATAVSSERTGDVISLAGTTYTTIDFTVQSNASDAQTFIQNAFQDTTVTSINAALDSSTGRLYIDANNDGNIDSVIQLTGVTTLTAAAFALA